MCGTWNMNDGHLIASSVDTTPATVSLRTTLYEKRETKVPTRGEIVSYNHKKT